jgi:hypothetical protein
MSARHYYCTAQYIPCIHNLLLHSHLPCLPAMSVPACSWSHQASKALFVQTDVTHARGVNACACIHRVP